jgi:hypothetical protein
VCFKRSSPSGSSGMPIPLGPESGLGCGEPKGVHSLALERNEHSLSRIHNREKMMVARQHMVLLGQFTVVVEDDTPIFS